MLAKYTPQLVNKLGLTFPVLSDPGCKVLTSFGIVFPLPQKIIDIYRGFGIDLDRFNGAGGWQLPLPGRIVIGRDGRVKNVELSTDHTERPEPADSLKLLQNL